MPQLQPAKDLARKSPANLRKALIEDAALVDLIRYTHFDQDPKVKGEKGVKSTPRYLAFIVTAKSITRVELPVAKDIEATLALWRQAITEGSPAEPKYAAQMHELLWQPLAGHLPASINRLYISPDAALTQLPWPALRDAKTNRVLLEHYRLAVVPHGPFLLDHLTRPKARPTESPTLLAMGGVAYDNRPLKPTQLAARDLAGDKLKWDGLPGTKKELDQLAALAGKRRLVRLEGDGASTNALLAGLPKADLAHLATHGFFADKRFRTVFQLDPKLFERVGSERATHGTRHPLVLSGVVCAGANRDDTPNRGVVTAEALVSLDLRRLRLAVLSACETGLGDVAGGEGVYGLTRAFHVAGCRDVVASLWKVDDEATAALMALFYRHLWDERDPVGPAEALRRAQLAMLRAEPKQVAEWAAGRGPLPKPVKGSAPAEKAVEAKGTTNKARVWAAFLVSGVGD